jgi:hypothetical protein
MAEVQRSRAAFNVASYRCREESDGSFRECLEPVARNYFNALRVFSQLILDRKAPEEPRI